MPRAPNPVDGCLGRNTEIATTTAALASSRLVTLTGPGGVGKTRIAQELAWSIADDFPDGAWLVPLGDLDRSADPTSASEALLRGLGVADQSARPAELKLAEHLADRELLLVLDNCEHVLSSVAPLIRHLLDASAGLRVLATSREPLELAGERVLTVPPLSVPPTTAGIGLDGLLASDAVRLLEARARAVDPEFVIREEDVPAVAELITRLDGLPLAIELCATRLRSLSAGQVLERLDNRLDMGSRDPATHAPRHRSLRDVIDWSHELCSPEHRLLWARLAVFPTSFDIAAAEDVCGFGDLDRGQVLEGIDRLVARSILHTERWPTGMRYRMLSTIREYAMEQLNASGEGAPLRRRHRDHYLTRVGSVLSAWASPTRLDALQEMDEERPHYAAAMSWSAAEADEHDAGLEFAAALRYHWLSGGHLAEGRRWLSLFLDKDVSPTTRAHGLWVASWVAMLQGDLSGAERYIDALRELPTVVDVAAHLDHWTGLLEAFSGRADRAVDLLERAAQGHRRRGADALEMSARFMQAYALSSAGRAVEAVTISTEVVQQTRQTGDHLNLAWAWWMRAYAHWKLADLDSAESDLREVLLVEQGFHDRFCIAGAVALLALVAQSRGDDAQAQDLASSGAGLFAALGTKPESLGWDFAQSWARLSTTLVAQDSSAPHQAARAAFDTDLDETLIVRELVERLGRPRVDASRRGGGLGALTTREREVAGLVAKGLTNREIAERLVIAPRTADGHVERILSKLGVRRRALVAAMVVSDVARSHQPAGNGP
nr:LuxR C-terminal-related transcriptional regulator [uncultured Nocardioides sp.]